MLSKEEQEAIEYFSVVNILYNQGLKDMKYLDDMASRMNMLLNLIEKLQKEIKHQRQQRKYWRDNFYKQQKEIEELKLDLEEMVKSNNHKNENWVHKNILNSCISKDKIREKLNYFEHSFDYDDNGESYELVMEVLDELLEEN
jgi:septal ring factor EnvC (AmiA/AmiB activator)